MHEELNLCVYIDDDNTSKMKRQTCGKSAPNRIIHLDEIVKLVDTKLGKYERCNKYELYLNKEEISGFGTNLSITCKGCNKEKSLLLRKI